MNTLNRFHMRALLDIYGGKAGASPYRCCNVEEFLHRAHQSVGDASRLSQGGNDAWDGP